MAFNILMLIFMIAMFMFMIPMMNIMTMMIFVITCKTEFEILTALVKTIELFQRN